MPKIPSSNPRQLIQASAVLHVADVVSTARYYEIDLGFTWDFGDENYAVVWRDNGAVHFVLGDNYPTGVHLFFWVRNVDQYYEELHSKHIQVETEPTTHPYGIREFSVKDLNGVLVVFGQDDELI